MNNFQGHWQGTLTNFSGSLEPAAIVIHQTGSDISGWINYADTEIELIAGQVDESGAIGQRQLLPRDERAELREPL